MKKISDFAASVADIFSIFLFGIYACQSSSVESMHDNGQCKNPTFVVLITTNKSYVGKRNEVCNHLSKAVSGQKKCKRCSTKT